MCASINKLPEGVERQIASYCLTSLVEVWKYRLVSRSWKACTREARLSLLLCGRRSDWNDVVTFWLNELDGVESVRFWRSNISDKYIAMCTRKNLVLSKCFAVSADLLRVLCTAELEALHAGDLFNNTVYSVGWSNRLRVLGLTNSSITCALLSSVALDACSLEALFVGGAFETMVSHGPFTDTVRQLSVLETTSCGPSIATAASTLFRASIELNFDETEVVTLSTVARRIPSAVFAAALEAADRRKQTALHRAALNNDAERVRFLLEAGADDRARDASGATPIVRAAERGSFQALAALLEVPCPPLDLGNHRNETPLNVAALKGHRDCVAIIVANEIDLAHRADLEGFTPLHSAVVGRHHAVVHLLIGELDVDAQNRYGQTPLHLAARTSDHILIDALLRAGANPNFTDDRGWTPLDTCLAFQRRAHPAQALKAADTLKKHGARYAVAPRRKHHLRSDLHQVSSSKHHRLAFNKRNPNSQHCGPHRGHFNL